jgi:glycosyltransferase involved in cell wall biosynthesis
LKTIVGKNANKTVAAGNGVCLRSIMLPLGVVIPTKNSMKYLPEHFANMATWIDLAEQVVVVDSFSTDGTVAFLKANLKRPRVLFASHPPGLYASWNHGIRQLTSEFCYISTVGDSITRAGLEHFVAAASQLDCDVLVSRPNFVDEAGQPRASAEWPMDIIIRRLDLTKPALVPPAVLLATALLHNGGAVSGSCSSDLFRTALLQKHPFPLDYGNAGDGAWSLQNAGRARWAATPEKVSTFRIHPPTASDLEIKTGRDSSESYEFAQMAIKAFSEWLESNPGDITAETRENIEKLLPLAAAYKEFHQRYKALKKGKYPWILKPSAWRARSRRNQIKSQINPLTQKIYNHNHSQNINNSLGLPTIAVGE